MIKLLSNLLARARGIKNETRSLANTATLVGGVMEESLLVSASRFDNDAAYREGQYAIFNGVLIEAVTDTLPVSAGGFLPDTVKGKQSWSFKIVTDPTQATGNKLPISADAAQQLLAAGGGGGGGSNSNATESTRGLARQASQVIYEAGMANDVYVTPKQVKTDIKALRADIDLLIKDVEPAEPAQPTTPAKTPGLAEVTAVNGITEHNILATNNSNYLIQLASYQAQGGLYLFAPNADGTFSLAGSFLYNGNGEVSFNNGVFGHSFRIGKQDAYLTTERLLAPNTALQLASVRRTQLPAASKPSGIWGTEADPVTQDNKDVLMSAKQVFGFVKAELDTYLRTLNLPVVPSSPSRPGTVYCQEVTDTPTSGGW